MVLKNVVDFWFLKLVKLSQAHNFETFIGKNKVLHS